MSLVQLQPGKADTRPTIRAAASLKYAGTRAELIANPARLQGLIKQAFAGQPFRGTRVVTCLPGDHVKMLLLKYTSSDGESESEAVIRELRKRVGEELDGMVVDYIPVRQERPTPTKEAIVALAARDKVESYLDMLAHAGVQVASLDVASAALVRLILWINTVETTPFQNLLLINFGFLNSYLTIVWGRRLMLDRPIDFGEQRLLCRLKNILDMTGTDGKRLLIERGLGPAPGAENSDEMSRTLTEVLQTEFSALKAEVSNTLVYTASRTHGRSVDSVYIVGSIARYPGIENILCEGLSLPIKILDPFAIFKHILNELELSHLLPCSGVATATGLALRGVPVPWPTSI